MIYCSTNQAVFITQTADFRQPILGRISDRNLHFLAAYGIFMALLWWLFVDRFLAVFGSFSALIANTKLQHFKVTSITLKF